MVDRRSAPRPRQAGRAILRDADGRVLLIRFVLPSSTGGMTFWATPGGGVEPGETALEAAHRELHEELGITAALEGPVHTATGIFEFEGELIENADTFFVGRFDGTAKLTGTIAAESASLQEVRWWTLDEMSSTKEDIFPRDLAQAIRRLG
jgi:8-oxo-dGTP pyrophosphatase MutT (NUDIX family)